MYRGKKKTEKDASNYKAMGVCYNNIANVHLKNGKYISAEQSFGDAIRCGEICKNQPENLGQQTYFDRILTYRRY